MVSIRQFIHKKKNIYHTYQSKLLNSSVYHITFYLQSYMHHEDDAKQTNPIMYAVKGMVHPKSGNFVVFLSELSF